MRHIFFDSNNKLSSKRVCLAVFTLLYVVLFFSNLYFKKDVSPSISVSLLDIMKYLIVAIFGEPIASKIGFNFGNKEKTEPVKGP